MMYKVYVDLPAGAVFLCEPLCLNPSLYSSRRQSFATQPPYKEMARKQWTLIKEGTSVFGDKGVDNNNSHVTIGQWIETYDLA